MPEGTRLAIETRGEHRACPHTDATIEAYIALAKEHSLDVCQMALAFVNQQPFVTSNLIGATTMQQLKSNIDSINLELSPDVIIGIKAIRRQHPMPF
jgi:aryl-alcohol dehydrogenase-like predicted oxidoreductase